jgi:hypothetical protein
MGFFGVLFWIAVIWLLIRWWRGSERCVSAGPREYAPGWYRSDRFDRKDTYETARRDDRQQYIDSLETRVSELEERLEFTERLLASRNEPGRGVVSS